MDQITVAKTVMLDVLRGNREKHSNEFDEALTGWKDKVLSELASAYADAQEDKAYKTKFDLPKPESHVDDYNRVIAMLEMDVSNEVSVSEYEFRRYVDDEWDWKRTFTATNSQYTAH